MFCAAAILVIGVRTVSNVIQLPVLPTLAALYREKKTNAAENRRHKTPVDLTCQSPAVLMHWFPEKKFVSAGDGGYGTHQMARLALPTQATPCTGP